MIYFNSVMLFCGLGQIRLHGIRVCIVPKLRPNLRSWRQYVTLIAARFSAGYFNGFEDLWAFCKGQPTNWLCSINTEVNKTKLPLHIGFLSALNMLLY